jgi:hypothetical protein
LNVRPAPARYELPTFHSITSSVSDSKLSENLTPSARRACSTQRPTRVSSQHRQPKFEPRPSSKHLCAFCATRAAAPVRGGGWSSCGGRTMARLPLQAGWAWLVMHSPRKPRNWTSLRSSSVPGNNSVAEKLASHEDRASLGTGGASAIEGEARLDKR